MTNYKDMAARVREMIDEYAQINSGFVRRDRDAMNEGWDPYTDPESGYLFDQILLDVDVDMDDDEGMDFYSCLVDEVADYLIG